MRTLPLIATLIVLATPTAGNAAKRGWQVGNDAVHLSNSDLNMNSAAGRTELLDRVEHAAERLCRDRTWRLDCIAEVVNAAARQPDAAPLRLALSERGAVRLAAR